MHQSQYSFTTSPSALVQVAEIASRYKGRQDKLMDVIIAVQKIVPSLAEDVAAVIAREMGLSQNHVYSFVTFYEYLSVQPRGKYMIRMCSSAPCHVRGAKDVMDTITEMLGIKIGETTPDNRFTVETCPCLGICDISPAIMINDKVYGDLDPERARELIKKYIREDI
ncbi:NADH-quinone oxidoreductase subunit NuoE family protein [Parasporobacterium paucivorans]|uniref:NADH-quinone oxidoreductase subunit E n=1 Tax=Parasporobacterium paucivorans DSM 15970 TaxID=1122934 RepID=A0A1M6J3K7_9FIRM|nr:NAD(P)H-dependent oxidoreductase subunit E [Parasporobacterium paucivorans]SHJ41278.1 NADH-quinone oxidoreductase subunit E [Parasporobacterium paucivorans DSM 15970]